MDEPGRPAVELSVRPSGEVWCTEMLATAAEVQASTDARGQAIGLAQLTALVAALPADLTAAEHFAVAVPLLRQLIAFAARVP